MWRSSIIIAYLTLGAAAIFDGLLRATANASHAMGTGSAPLGSAFNQSDIIERTKLGAIPTADAFFSSAKGLGLDNKMVKQRVNQQAANAAEKSRLG